MPSLSVRWNAPISRFSTHRHAPEQAPALGRLRDAGLDDLRRRARVMSSPAKSMLPLRGRSRPEIVFSVVDLPAPLAPSSVTISPSPTVERDALERVDRAVVGVHVRELEQRARGPGGGGRAHAVALVPR